MIFYASVAGEFFDYRRFPRTNNAELWLFICYWSEQAFEQFFGITARSHVLDG